MDGHVVGAHRCVLSYRTADVVASPTHIIRDDLGGREARRKCAMQSLSRVYRYLNKSDVTSGEELIMRVDSDKKP